MDSPPLAQALTRAKEALYTGRLTLCRPSGEAYTLTIASGRPLRVDIGPDRIPPGGKLMLLDRVRQSVLTDELSPEDASDPVARAKHATRLLTRILRLPGECAFDPPLRTLAPHPRSTMPTLPEVTPTSHRPHVSSPSDPLQPESSSPPPSFRRRISVPADPDSAPTSASPRPRVAIPPEAAAAHSTAPPRPSQQLRAVTPGAPPVASPPPRISHSSMPAVTPQVAAPSPRPSPPIAPPIAGATAASPPPRHPSSPATSAAGPTHPTPPPKGSRHPSSRRVAVPPTIPPPTAGSSEEAAEAVALRRERAKAKVALQDFKAADAILAELAAFEHKDPEAEALGAWVRANLQNNLDGPLETLDMLLLANPKCEHALYYRGLILKRAGQRKAALRDFVTVAKQNPKHAPALVEIKELRASLDD